VAFSLRVQSVIYTVTPNQNYSIKTDLNQQIQNNNIGIQDKKFNNVN
jgi:hypothetical protein